MKSKRVGRGRGKEEGRKRWRRRSDRCGRGGGGVEKEEEKCREGGIRGKEEEEEGRRSNLFSIRIRVGHYM